MPIPVLFLLKIAEVPELFEIKIRTNSKRKNKQHKLKKKKERERERKNLLIWADHQNDIHDNSGESATKIKITSPLFWYRNAQF